MEYIEISSVSYTSGIEATERYTFEKAPSRARRVVRDGDTIVSTVRTYLKAVATIRDAPDNLIASTGFVVLRPEKEIDAGFLGYYAKSQGFVDAIVAQSVGVSYPATNASDVVRLPVPIPPTDEQLAIARFLDAKTAEIDALIAKKRRLLDLLAEQRAALITQIVSKGLNTDVPLKPSGLPWLGDIPAHWEMKRLKFISPFQSVGVVVNPSSYVDDSGDIPFLYGANIRDYVIDAASARRTNDRFAHQMAKSRLSAGDLVVVRVGAPGVAAVITPDLDGANCASVLFIRRGEFDSDWLAHVLNSRIGRYQVELVQYGAAQKQFNVEHALDFNYPVPPLDEQKQISAFGNDALARERHLASLHAAGIERLLERRSALITAAVTGQIDVRNWSAKRVAA